MQKFTDQLRLDAPELFPNNSTPSNNDPISRRPTTATTADTINDPLESWTPTRTPPYDLIWNQWCLGHLTDTQLTAYLRRLGPALAPNGWIVVKENVLGDGSRRFPATTNTSTCSFAKRATGAAAAADDEDINDNDHDNDNNNDDDADDADDDDGGPEQDLYDEVDSSVTRSAGKFELLFRRAGLRVVRTELQRGFGRGLGLYPVRMWGLQPVGPEEQEGEGGE